MIPVSYNFRNLAVRWKTTLMTSMGFTLVVAVLTIILAFVNGIQAVCIVSGREENVIVLSGENSDEILSQVDRRTARHLELAPGLARGADGRTLASRELFTVVTQKHPVTGLNELLQFRGVYPVAFQVHDQVRIIAGRALRRNGREVMVGASMAAQQELEPGDQMQVGQNQWEVVGIFAAGGSAFETEAWCDLDQLASQFQREGIYSSVVLRGNDASGARNAVAYLNNSRVVNVNAQTEVDYYRAQAEQANILRTGAYVIAVFMSIGAVAALTNTVFAAIGERTKDIAVMRLLGFERREILLSFLIETMVIALLGGCLGCLLGYAVNGVTMTAPLSDKAVAFAFRVDAATLVIGMFVAAMMGFVGGIFPAWSAMWVDPLDAMR